MGKALLGALMIVGASTLGGLLGYGTYGYLKDKKRWSSWKAGAATGAIGGVAAAVLTLVGVGASEQTVGQLPSAGPRRDGSGMGLRRNFGRGGCVPPLGRGQIPSFGALVVNRLYGCSACGG